MKGDYQMKTLVIYFSRTGNSKRVAEKIAQEVNCQIAVLEDDENWKGPAGFAKGAMYAARWENTRPSVSPQIDINDFEKIVIVSPVWAGNPAPAVYSYIMQDLAQHLDKICLVLTCGGMMMPVPSKIESMIGHLDSIHVIVKIKADEKKAVAKIIDELLSLPS
jgi:hypothetical protein